MSTKLLELLIDQLSVLFENSVFPKHLVNDLPRKWEKHGDLIVFSANAFSMDEWKNIDPEALWQTVANVFKVTRIAKQQRISTDGFRTPKVFMLFGIDPWVTHLDNRIKYSFDVTKNMFSSGNITEKMRMSKLDCSNEVVVDMFAGIGYFSLPLLVHARAKHLHACEWNPDAISALRTNLKDNKVEQRCSVYFGDNRKVCPVGIANRILLGLIPSARMSYYTACLALDPNTGGTMHIHCNVTSNKPSTEQKTASLPHSEQSVGSGLKLPSNLRQNGNDTTSIIVDNQPLNSGDMVDNKSLNSGNMVKNKPLNSGSMIENKPLNAGNMVDNKLLNSGDMVDHKPLNDNVISKQSTTVGIANHKPLDSGEEDNNKLTNNNDNIEPSNFKDMVDNEPSNCGNMVDKKSSQDTVPFNICVENVSCNRSLKSDWLKWGQETAMEMEANLKSISNGEVSWKLVIKHIERVKSYAPHIDHLVLDLVCIPSK